MQGAYKIFIVWMLLCGLCQAQQKTDSFNLDKKDLFIITEYKEVDYQSFADGSGSSLPANLSATNFYVDINGKTTDSSIVDLNYLYLQDYHLGKDEGLVFYLLTKKNRPIADRKTNIRSAKIVDQYSDIRSIDNMTFGYWKRNQATGRIIIMFRDRTKIWNMQNFRIFAGLVVQNNIYLTDAMNTKDDYLFDYNFKNNKVLDVKLPLDLKNVFYSQKILDQKENSEVKQAMLASKTNSVMAASPGAGDSIAVSVKYWKYTENKPGFDRRRLELMDFDSLDFKFVSGRCGRKKKYALFDGQRHGSHVYSRINISHYQDYYGLSNRKEYITIHVIDPYDGSSNTFRVAYSGENFIPRMISFFKKKVFDI